MHEGMEGELTRHNFTKATMIARFRQCGGRCEGILESGERCNVVLVPGRWECHHHNPDGLTGEPTLSNARCLCIPCHKAITPIDKAYIAQAHQREAKNIGVPWPKQKMRGFAKPEKPAREKLPMPERRKDAYGRMI